MFFYIFQSTMLPRATNRRPTTSMVSIRRLPQPDPHPTAMTHRGRSTATLLQQHLNYEIATAIVSLN